MNYKTIVLALLIVVLVSFSFVACSGEEQITVDSDNNFPIVEEKIDVMVSVLPQVLFVEAIGGDKVDVTEMIPPGFSPATYEPSPEQLKKLQSADFYFRIGHIPFEKSQMDKLEDINPNMQIVDTSEGIVLLELLAHSHGDEDEHDHHEEGGDPHIWLSPSLVKIQAKHIYDALVDYSPEDELYFSANYDEFIKNLNELDLNLSENFEAIQGEKILVFHPAFGYLANDYGFVQEAIEIEGKDPSPQQIQEIISEAKENNVKVIFVQEQFSTKGAEAIAHEIDGVVVKIDPLAKDYFANLENMADTIVKEVL